MFGKWQHLAKGQKVDGVCVGYWEWFRLDGTKKRSGHFENGEQIGEWITYDKQGQKYKVTNQTEDEEKWLTACTRPIALRPACSQTKASE